MYGRYFIGSVKSWETSMVTEFGEDDQISDLEKYSDNDTGSTEDRSWEENGDRSLEKAAALLFLVRDKAVSVKVNKQKRVKDKFQRLRQGLELKFTEVFSLGHWVDIGAHH